MIAKTINFVKQFFYYSRRYLWLLRIKIKYYARIASFPARSSRLMCHITNNQATVTQNLIKLKYCLIKFCVV